jgi:hypothetical protein
VAAPVIAATFLVLLTTPLPYQGTPFFLPRDALFQVVSIASLLFLAAASALRLGVDKVLVGSLVAGVLLRAHGIDHHEINAVHRDMLPLVQYACEAFLDGRNPYSILYYANHDLPLTYLPVMWLTYLPAIVLEADVRWTSVVATCVIAVVILRWGARRASGEDRFDAGLGAVSAAFVFQPEVFWNSVHGEPIVYWFWLVLFLDAVWAGRPWRAALVMGLMLAVRHFSILFVPFAALWYLAGRGPLRLGLLRLLVAGALSCLLVMPFFVGHPDSFLYGVYDWLVTYGASRRSWWDVQIGFQQLFYHAGRESILPYVQAAVAAASVAVAAGLTIRAALARRNGRAHDLASWFPLVVGYAPFILFNSMIWKSFLFPVLLMLVFAGAVAARPRSGGRAGPAAWEDVLLRPRIYTPVALALVVVLAWSAFMLARGFRRHRDLRDIQFAAQYVAARCLWGGDLLVDWSCVQAGHVHVPSLFQGTSLPQGVRPVRRMRSQDLTGFERIVLFDGFSRFDPELDFPDLVRVTSRRLGRSSLHVFRPPHHMGGGAWRLSNDPLAVTGAALVSKKPPTIQATLHSGRWTFPGRPVWNYVGPTVQRVVGRPMKCIWAHPVGDLILRIDVDVPRPGEAVLVTALDDGAVRPLLAPVRLSVSAAGEGRDAIHLTSPNAPGRWFWGLGTLEAGHLAVEVAAERPGMRHLCFDLLLAPGDDGG